MLGFRYIKRPPSVHLMHFAGGKLVRSGAGLAFFYFAPSSSLVAIPLSNQEAPFVFREISRDFQEITLQGQATFRVTNPQALAERMDFSVGADGESYSSEDPAKLPGRLINAIGVQVRSQVQAASLQDLLSQAEHLETAVRGRLRESEALAELGIGLVDLSFLAIRPTPETGRALEAEVREQILKRADDATYARRNAAIEQERAIRENELQTEIAVDAKKRQIREAQLDAERAELEKRQEIEAQAIAGRIAQEQQNASLVDLQVANSEKKSEAQSRAVRGLMSSVAGVDPRVLQAMNIGNSDPAATIALAFQGLAENAARIGELNISPELLQSLTRTGKSGGKN